MILPGANLRKPEQAASLRQAERLTVLLDLS
jgi:hypothetical protein